MNKILSLDEAIKISGQLREKHKTLVLVGGVFDILHIGHIRFLEEAKKLGHVLLVLLESDENVRLTKGTNRPFNSQNKRAEMLAQLISPDYIILLPKLKKDQDYDHIVISLKPDIIAVTKKDPVLSHKIRQAKKIDAKIAEVIERLPVSTSKIAKYIEKDLI